MKKLRLILWIAFLALLVGTLIFGLTGCKKEKPEPKTPTTITTPPPPGPTAPTKNFYEIKTQITDIPGIVEANIYVILNDTTDGYYSSSGVGTYYDANLALFHYQTDTVTLMSDQLNRFLQIKVSANMSNCQFSIYRNGILICTKTTLSNANTDSYSFFGYKIQ